MEQTVQTASQQPVISTGGVDIDRLQQWYKEYMAVDVNDLKPKSLIILAVDSDDIDVGYIESQIQQAMLTILTKFETHVVSPSANCYEDWVDNFDIANKWIRTCSEGHEACHSKNELKRPSRLISIANEVKLVLTADWETFPQYATLSYCWGSDEFIKLTSDKFDSFLNKIPHEDLPKTFKDGIYIARRLGLDYIWIDALCIIQGKDGNDDWQRESGRMRFVYGSAHVNIAASSATNVYAGCFSKPTNYIDGFLARVTTSEFCRVQNFHSMGVYEESTIRTHLATRAWTFQEKLLAPRTIYFGNRGMFWECRSTIASEFCPDWIKATTIHNGKLVCPEGEAWSWYYIVRNYSRANLTQSTDKLPALSGVARRQHEATGDEYLAGMWRKRLTKQLGWLPHSKNKRPSWRAPTWSWTSLDAEISYWNYWNYDPLAKNEYVQVMDARTTLAGSDPFGAVSGGELQLRCTAMVRQHYSKPGNAEDVELGASQDGRAIANTKTQIFPFAMDCLEDDFIKAGNSIFLLSLFGGESGMQSLVKEVKGSGEEGNEDEVGKKWVAELMIRGLVLQHSGLTKGCFRRIGFFDFRHTPFSSDDADSKRDYYHEFLQAVEEVGASTAETECAEIILDTEHPESRYVIVIV